MTPHFRNIFTPGHGLVAVITSMLLLGIIAPAAFNATSDDSLNFKNAPFVGAQPAVTSFDAPGAGTGPNQGTQPFGINPSGVITGFYTDAGDANHGFMRNRNGAITTFDPPGAGTGPGQGTNAFSITPAGAIAGRYSDASDVFHGFLRTPDGAITTFDAPGAGTGANQGTRTANEEGLSPAGAIVGGF